MNMIGDPHRLLAGHTDFSLRLEPVLLLGWGTLFLSRHVCFFSLLSFLPPAYTSCQGKFTVLVFLPSLTEQRAIATVLSDMDAEIAALEQKRDKTRALKQGMMQELLTGKTRLV